MIYTTSGKLFVLMAILLAVLVQNSCAQYNNNDADTYECPDEYLIFYKDCQGSLQQCSNCLNAAEKKCSAARKEQGKTDYICFDCTALVNHKCDSIKPMCFGPQDCHGANEQCIDRTCTYVPS